MPKRKKAIGCKWVFVKKQGFLDGDTVHFMARLVAKHYVQWENIEYNEVFLPVVKHSSIQILLALVTQYKLDFDQLNIKIAFLHGDLDEENLMSQPMGFKTAKKENMVCKLKKIILWVKTITKAVI